jgi:predicted RNase H-like HicB family nuclease
MMLTIAPTETDVSAHVADLSLGASEVTGQPKAELAKAEHDPRLSQYVAAALARARFEALEDGTVYASIAGLRGVWANAGTQEAAREELRDVLNGWLIVRRDRGLPIPVIDGIDLPV